MDSDWMGLPQHLLDLILNKLETLSDHMKFSSICVRWHSVQMDNYNKAMNLSRHEVPMLLVPSTTNEENNKWSVYSILDNKFLAMKLSLPLYDRPFGGSSEGWLVTLNQNLAVTLYKPFADNIENMTICLPPLFPANDLDVFEHDVQYREYYMFKMTTITPDPIANPKDIIVVVIFGEFCGLAYIRPAKNNTWIRANGIKPAPYDDIMHYKNQFYALTIKGELVSLNVTDTNESATKLVPVGIPCDHSEKDFCLKRYLVVSYGEELLQVERYSLDHDDDEENSLTKKFKVFKLNFDELKWVEVKNLGDEALFLGDNTSVSVLASNFVGCEKNCIYFTHDKDSTSFIGARGPWDLGVFNLETGSVTRGFTIDGAAIAKMFGPRPIWVVPAFNTY